ncbi:serine/threonine protein kinase [Anatilimnocola floriformis]|uniref:serine/threonine protein kinase n=1 Tax=Anatilimnocola floriformis TaxID=2948575 RepID=UPI0020C30C64|nr:serine/threonine-protein kinase [Anatilimnocola floriformis]
MTSNEPTLPFEQPGSHGDEKTLPVDAERISQLGLETALHIDRLCAEFEQELRRDLNCRLESWLAKCSPPERLAAFQELLAIEWEERARHGKEFAATEYIDRFPEYQSVIERLVKIRKESATTLGLVELPATLPIVDKAPTTARELFGEFEILSEIGYDGPWLLRKARQTQLNRMVILKSPKLETDPAKMEALAAALHQEAETAAKLDHPGILPVVGSGEWEGVPYLALGSVDGETLADKLVRGPLDNRLAAEYARQLAETLFAVHQAGVRHGNLRPEDIFIGRDGRLRLTGFQAADILPRNLTSFTAPERRPGFSSAIDHRIDVYGIGVLLYVMLTGQPLYQADNDFALWGLIAKGKFRPPREWNRRIDRDLEAICQRALAPDPYNRYRGRLPTQTLIADLRRFLSGHAVEARPDAFWRKPLLWARRNRRPFVTAVAALLLLVLAIGWERWRAQQAWSRILTEQVTVADAESSRAFFARRDYFQPHYEEFAVGRALATLRARGPEVALKEVCLPESRRPHFAFRQAQNKAWNSTLTRIQCQIALRLGYYHVATALLGKTEQLPRHPADLVLSLENAVLMNDADLLAVSVRRHDEKAIFAAAKIDPSNDLIRALLEIEGTAIDRTIHNRDGEPHADEYFPRQSYSAVDNVRLTLAKLQPKLSQSPGARRAIPKLIVAYAEAGPNNGERLLQILNSIDPKWRSSPEAREAIGPVFALKGITFTETREGLQARAKSVDDLLLSIDPQWLSAKEAEAAVPLLASHLEQQSQLLAGMRLQGRQSPNQRYEPLWAAYDILKLLGPRAKQARPALEKMLAEGDLPRMVGAAGLAAIDLNWLQTAEAKRLLSEVIASYPVEFGVMNDAQLKAREQSQRPTGKPIGAHDFALALKSLSDADREAAIVGLIQVLPDERALEALVQLEKEWQLSPFVRELVPSVLIALQQDQPPLRVANLCWLLGKIGTENRAAQVELLKRINSVESVLAQRPIYELVRGQPTAGPVSVGEVACKSLDSLNPLWREDPSIRAHLSSAITAFLHALSRSDSYYNGNYNTILVSVCNLPLILDNETELFDDLSTGIDADNLYARSASHKIIAALGWRGARFLPVLTKAAREPGALGELSRATMQSVLFSAHQSPLSVVELRAEVGDALDLENLLPLLTLPRSPARKDLVQLLDHQDRAWREASATSAACKQWQAELEQGVASAEWARAASALHLCDELSQNAQQVLIDRFQGTNSVGDKREAMREQRRSAAHLIGEMELATPAVLKALLDSYISQGSANYDDYVASSAEDALAKIGVAALPATLERLATADEKLRTRYFHAAIREDAKLMANPTVQKQVEQWCRDLAERPTESPAIFGLHYFSNLPAFGITPASVLPALRTCLAERSRWRTAAPILGNFGPDGADALPTLLSRVVGNDLSATDRELLWNTVNKLDPWGAPSAQVGKALEEQNAVAEQILAQCLKEIPPPPGMVSEAFGRLTGKSQKMTQAEREAMQRAFRVLGHLRAKAQPAVPILLESFRGRADERYTLAQTLGRIGPTAREAIPELVRGLTSDEHLTRIVSQSLSLIDPGWNNTLEFAEVRQLVAAESLRSLQVRNPPWKYHLALATVSGMYQQQSAAGPGEGEFIPIDLSPFANELLKTRIGTGENHLEAVPQGSFSCNGCQFIIGSRYVHLAGGWDVKVNKSTKAIPLDLHAHRIHFLHSTWAGSHEGLVVGRYLVRYTDESELIVPIVYGLNISDWWVHKTNTRHPLPYAETAWEGTNPQADASGCKLVLNRFTWVNPYPNKQIQSVEFANIPSSASGCCLVAMSAEQVP